MNHRETQKAGDIDFQHILYNMAIRNNGVEIILLYFKEAFISK